MMKGLFAVLLVANIAFLGWHLVQPAPSPPPLPDPALWVPDEGARLVGAGPPAGSSPIRARLGTGQPCYTLRVYGGESIAAPAREAIMALGGTIQAEGTLSGEMTRFWLMVPSLPGSEEVGEVVGTLQRHGIDDLFVVPTGENRNAISLGVFSTAEAALGRRAEHSGWGPRPIVREITTPISGHWFHVYGKAPAPGELAGVPTSARVLLSEGCEKP